MLTGAVRQFLNPAAALTEFDLARFVVLPLPYEGGVSYGRGAAAGPDAIIRASAELELYDGDFDLEPSRAGVCTLAAPALDGDAIQVGTAITAVVDRILATHKFPLVIGGDHSVTPACVRAVARHEPTFGVVQFDAHADLRETYNEIGRAHV